MDWFLQFRWRDWADKYNDGTHAFSYSLIGQVEYYFSADLLRDVVLGVVLTFFRYLLIYVLFDFL